MTVKSWHDGWGKIREELDELWELVRLKSAERQKKEILQLAIRELGDIIRKSQEMLEFLHIELEKTNEQGISSRAKN